MNQITVRYNDRVVRQFVVASLLWTVVALAVGLLIAIQLLVVEANLSVELSFGRLRPVHVHLAVFALAGNIVFAGIYDSSQRLLEARLPSDRLAAIHVWGWQLAVAAGAGVAVLRGVEGGGASVAWPIDLLTASLWFVFAGNFFALVRRRHRERLDISLWFYIAAILALAAVHLVSVLVVPIGWLASYPILGGAAGELARAWADSGLHSFLFIAPFVGFMYYLVPLAAGRPLYSRRLAVFHLWAFLFVAGWVAPQTLLHTAIPDWLQALGLVFGLLLWIPAWAGVIGGLATMRGAGSRLLGDPVLMFAAAALVCLGLAALEAPLLGAGSFSTVTGYTDWMHGRSHLATMGWVGFMAAALLYGMVPRLYGVPLRSLAAARAHLYLAVVGLLLYAGATWLAGATQGVMLHSQNAAGGLTYEFFETVAALDLAYGVRIAGGALYVVGVLLMVWNLSRTIAAGRPVATEVEVRPRTPGAATAGLRELLLAPPVLVAALTVTLLVAAGSADVLAALATFVLAGCVGAAGLVAVSLYSGRRPSFHGRLECHALALSILIAAASFHGGAVGLGGLIASRGDGGQRAAYTALEIAGRDVYRREGCANCHTQMVRPLLPEVARYGEVTAAVDPNARPALWGSRRVGPDLARIGGEPAAAYFERLVAPQEAAPVSRMPSYGHLIDRRVDPDALPRKLGALAALGAPYRRDDIDAAARDARAQGVDIAAELARSLGVDIEPTSEMIALIAYLQSLGVDDRPLEVDANAEGDP